MGTSYTWTNRLLLVSYCVYSQWDLSQWTSTPIEGDDLTLTCRANYSIPAPTFVWTRDNLQIFNSADISIQTRVEVGDLGPMTYSSDLTLRNVPLAYSGYYSCSTRQSDSILSTPVNSTSSPFRVEVFSKFVLLVCIYVTHSLKPCTSSKCALIER